jgi:pimeloyl-ACP methyl ester carboxylesterase
MHDVFCSGALKSLAGEPGAIDIDKEEKSWAKSRSLEDIKNDIARRAGESILFERVDRKEVEGLLGRLTSLDPDLWGSEWGKLGARHEANAEELEKLGKKEAGEAYYQAYEYYRIGRYPVPSSPEKMHCYKGALRSFLKAAPYLDPPLEQVEIPFEGKKVVGYLQIPRGVSRPPVVMHWGGVDGWKEDRRSNSEVFHKEGLATFTIDMPGAGENPCLGQEPRAERTFPRPSTISKRARYRRQAHRRNGRSFGGYWAAKLAHTEPKRLRGAVNWGAGVHRTFQEEWLRPALTVTASQYLMGPASLLDARSYIFGVKTLEEVLNIAPSLSLVTQGLIDQPCAPLLCINGKEDDQHPISDFYLLAEHGSPKAIRIIAGAGHMGRKPGSPATKFNRSSPPGSNKNFHRRNRWLVLHLSKKEDLAPEHQPSTMLLQRAGVLWAVLWRCCTVPSWRANAHLGSYVRFESSLDHKLIELTALATHGSWNASTNGSPRKPRAEGRHSDRNHSGYSSKERAGAFLLRGCADHQLCSGTVAYASGERSDFSGTLWSIGRKRSRRIDRYRRLLCNGSVYLECVRSGDGNRG